MFINKEKKIAKKIARLLYQRGFFIKTHKSKTSKSIYIKVDNGVIPVIRISDHKRANDDNCKYNVIRNYRGPRQETINRKLKKYYNYNENNINRLITDIELERNTKISAIGFVGYRNILEGRTEKSQYKYANAA